MYGRPTLVFSVLKMLIAVTQYYTVLLYMAYRLNDAFSSTNFYILQKIKIKKSTASKSTLLNFINGLGYYGTCLKKNEILEYKVEGKHVQRPSLILMKCLFLELTIFCTSVVEKEGTMRTYGEEVY